MVASTVTLEHVIIVLSGKTTETFVGPVGVVPTLASIKLTTTQLFDVTRYWPELTVSSVVFAAVGKSVMIGAIPVPTVVTTAPDTFTKAALRSKFARAQDPGLFVQVVWDCTSLAKSNKKNTIMAGINCEVLVVEGDDFITVD